MSREEFIKFIESIGFKYNKHKDYYDYKEYSIYLYRDHYDFYNGLNWWWNKDYNDLTPLKQIERSYKLKKILV